MGAVFAHVFIAATLVAPSPHSLAQSISVIERGAFATSLSAFPRFEKTYRKQFPQLDWTTDYCSSPLVGNTGRSFNFAMSCRRHDFGYRSFKLVSRSSGINFWTEDLRFKVDLQFYNDMLSNCEPRGISQRLNCRAWARTFFQLVRTLGS
jgi:hypothetical protein